MEMHRGYSAQWIAPGRGATLSESVLERRMNTDLSSSATVRVRKHWNAPDVTDVSAEILSDLHFRNDPGGVCSAFPRAFLCAHVWCDKLAAGALGHICRQNPPAPHELLVYVLPADNTAETYEALRTKARG
jgi:hypothetical protein